jgi:hypothetical protein
MEIPLAYSTSWEINALFNSLVPHSVISSFLSRTSVYLLIIVGVEGYCCIYVQFKVQLDILFYVLFILLYS